MKLFGKKVKEAEKENVKEKVEVEVQVKLDYLHPYESEVVDNQMKQLILRAMQYASSGFYSKTGLCANLIDVSWANVLGFTIVYKGSRYAVDETIKMLKSFIDDYAKREDFHFYMLKRELV